VCFVDSQHGQHRRWLRLPELTTGHVIGHPQWTIPAPQLLVTPKATSGQV
jgi:hypothetical protein